VQPNTCFSVHKFTGKEHDFESGLENFEARFDSSTMGRFLSPDDPNVDQDPANPQSWNLYSYVRNNPLNNTDPDGHECSRDSDGNLHGDCANPGDEKVTQADKPQTVEVRPPRPSLGQAFFLIPRGAAYVLAALRNAGQSLPSPPQLSNAAMVAIGTVTGFPEANELSIMTNLILREAAAGMGNFGVGAAQHKKRPKRERRGSAKEQRLQATARPL
jgi:RHS repeat-associated protein